MSEYTETAQIASELLEDVQRETNGQDTASQPVHAPKRPTPCHISEPSEMDRLRYEAMTRSVSVEYLISERERQREHNRAIAASPAAKKLQQAADAFQRQQEALAQQQEALASMEQQWLDLRNRVADLRSQKYHGQCRFDTWNAELATAKTGLLASMGAVGDHQSKFINSGSAICSIERLLAVYPEWIAQNEKDIATAELELSEFERKNGLSKK